MFKNIKQKREIKISKSIIKISEIFLKKDNRGMGDPILKFFTQTPKHWIMLHKVLTACYYDGGITKKNLIKSINGTYVTSNKYIDSAIKKKYFCVYRNPRDSRSIIVCPCKNTIDKLLEFTKKFKQIFYPFTF